MDVIKAVKTRRSIRNFAPKNIEENKIMEVMEAGRLAPSASNRQDWKFILIRDKRIISLIAEASNNQVFIAGAPAVIIACSTNPLRKMSCGQLSGTVDVAIAVTHMMLKATEEGLGTCWIGAFKEDEVKKILHIPADISAVALFPIGYPAETPKPPPRKDKSEVFLFEKWE